MLNVSRFSIGVEAKSECVKRLLREQRDLLIQVAKNSITAQHLEQILFVYRRYLIALLRTQNAKDLNKSKQICRTGHGPILKSERRSTNVSKRIKRFKYCCTSFNLFLVVEVL